MKRRGTIARRAPALLAAAFLMSSPAALKAQESVVEGAPPPARTVAEKIDEYGDIRWCDFSARLDNFAILLQNEPGLKAFIVGYDSEKGKVRAASKRFRVTRHYLVYERGIEHERLVFVAAGARPDGEAVTELWAVPEGAVPPVTPPPAEDAGKQFSGKLGSYFTDDTFYGFMSELGPSETDIEFPEFAERLKAQPDSTGYLVIRAAKGSVPGAWKRIARRDEETLRAQYQVEADRLQSIDGGFSEDEYAAVELWVLPKDALAPAGIVEKLERLPAEAFQLDGLDYEERPDADLERWVLGNLAEQLKDDPQASAVIIIRPYEPEPPGLDSEEGESGGESSQAEASAEVEAGPAEGAGEEESAVNPQALAERWRQTLVEKYGIEFHRVQVMFGRPQHFVNGQLLTWVVPRDAPLPDPFAVTQDKEQFPEEQPGEEADMPPGR